MRAIIYAKKFKIDYEKDKFEAVINVIIDLIFECEAMIYLRTAHKNSAVISIIKEQNFKWKDICKIINKEVPILNINGFELFIKERMEILI